MTFSIANFEIKWKYSGLWYFLLNFDFDIWFWFWYFMCKMGKQMDMEVILVFSTEKVEKNEKINIYIFFANIFNVENFYWKCEIKWNYSSLLYFVLQKLKTNGYIDDFYIVFWNIALLKTNGNIANFVIFYWKCLNLLEIYLIFSMENIEIKWKHSWFWYFLLKCWKQMEI